MREREKVSGRQRAKRESEADFALSTELDSGLYPPGDHDLS